MGLVRIDYSEIYDASKYAKKVSTELNDYANHVDKNVTKQLEYVSGSGGTWHSSNAASAARNKVKELQRRSSYYADVSKNIHDMASRMENIERNVVNRTNTIARFELELQKRTMGEQVIDFLYDVFCVKLTNLTPLTRKIGNFINKGINWAANLKNKAAAFFIHGNGRYYFKLVADFVSTGIAIYSAYTAVAALSAALAAGPVGWVIVGGALLLTLAAAMKTGDLAVSGHQRVKALRVAKTTNDPGRARFYGEISGVKDYTKKTDLGGKTANQLGEIAGTGYEFTKNASESLGKILYGAGCLGFVHSNATNPATGRQGIELGYDKNLINERLIGAIKEKFGFRNYGSGYKFNIKNLFSTGRKSGCITEKIKIYQKYIKRSEFGSGVVTAKSVFDVVGKVHKYAEKILTFDSNTLEKTIDGTLSDLKTTPVEVIAGGVSNLYNFKEKGNFNFTSPLKDAEDIFKAGRKILGSFS